MIILYVFDLLGAFFVLSTEKSVKHTVYAPASYFFSSLRAYSTLITLSLSVDMKNIPNQIISHWNTPTHQQNKMLLLLNLGTPFSSMSMNLSMNTRKSFRESSCKWLVTPPTPALGHRELAGVRTETCLSSSDSNDLQSSGQSCSVQCRLATKIKTFCYKNTNLWRDFQDIYAV